MTDSYLTSPPYGAAQRPSPHEISWRFKLATRLDPGQPRGGKVVRDEVGVLVYIHSYESSLNKCYLVIEYRGEHYVGTLLFDDATFCHQITALLRQHIGLLIEEIGDLDLSHFF